MIAETPSPPYYVVIFTSERSKIDDGYAEMAERMLALASEQPGFLGVESARDPDGDNTGITVSYWRDLASITQWKANSEHRLAQHKGREIWYRRYRIRIAMVERDYGIE